MNKFIIHLTNETASLLPGTVRRVLLAFLAAFLVIFQTGCSAKAKESEPFQTEFFAMDTYMTMSAYGKNAEEACKKAENEILRLDGILNVEDSESEIAFLNRTGETILKEDCGHVMEEALHLYEETDGAFDISIYPLTKLWGFPAGRLYIPSKEELQETLSLVGSDKIVYDKDTRKVLFEKEGMAVDAGGIGKGYASACAAGVLKKEGITSALINLGGNVYAIGAKPDGSDWKIGIQHPEDKERFLGILEVRDVCVITSGTYERFFEEDGIRYHHILDPRTGNPVRNGLVSVTVVSEDATRADGLSTGLFVMGKEKACRFWREHAEEFQMILMEESGEVYVTEGVAGRFRSDFEVQIIS